MQYFKIGILIPLKARKVAQNWAVVETALYRVLRSINNQTSNDFECVVIGHDEPQSYNICDVSSNTTFVKFDEFEPPRQDKFSGMQLQLKYEFDRCSKIAKGIKHLENNNITHWFALDADDLLHENFVKTISKLESSDAIVIDNGYFYFENKKIINKNNNFSLYCGSSCIIKSHVTAIPTKIDEKAYRQMFYGAVSHMDVKDYFLSHNLSYIVPEERLIMYIRDNGENISNFYFTDWLPRVKKWIKMHLKAIRFSNQQYQSFGFRTNNNK